MRRGCGSSSLPIAVAACLVLAGCGPARDPQGFLAQLGTEWRALVAVLQGQRSPLAPGAKAPTKGSPAGESGSRETEAQASAELLREVMQVVFLKEPKNPAVFGGYLNTLHQGASIEGLYNGFTHSAQYRQLETLNPGAGVKALKRFAAVLARIEAGLADPAEFTERSALPLAVPVQPGVDVSTASASPAPLAAPDTSKKASPEGLAAAYEKTFSKASIYTLKRVLGDEALRLVDQQAAKGRDALAKWYGAWVAEQALLGVDFGLEPRNRPDPAFHAAWALKASEDRLKWEVLNRVHRLLNEANREMVAPSAQ